MEGSISEEAESDSFKTPLDNFKRMEYHNKVERILRRGRHFIKRSLINNFIDSTPCSVGMISLRRINLVKSFGDQFCMVRPDAYSRLKYSVSNTVQMSVNSLVDCEQVLCPLPRIEKMNLINFETPSLLIPNSIVTENVKNIASELGNEQTLRLAHLNQPEMDRLPTFVPSMGYTNSLSSGNFRLNTLCDTRVHFSPQRTNTIHKEYEICDWSPMCLGDADSRKSSRKYLLTKPLKVVSPKQINDLISTPSNLSQTIRADDSLTETSTLEFSDNRHGCKEHVQQLSSNVLACRTPTNALQSWFSQNLSTQRPYQDASSNRSYACGKVFTSSFNDCSFSPVHVTLPPESPLRSSDLVTEKILETSDISTIYVTEKQDTDVSSGGNMHIETNGKAHLDSIQIEKSKETAFCITNLKQQYTCMTKSNQIKLKVTNTSAIKARKVMNSSVKADSTSEFCGQRKTRTMITKLKQACHKGHSKESSDIIGHMDRSDSEIKLNVSVNNQHATVTTHTEIDLTTNYSENVQCGISTDLTLMKNVDRSQHLVTALSTRTNDGDTEKARSFQAKNSGTLTDATNVKGKVLSRRKYENVKNQALTNPQKDHNIAADRAEIHKEEQKFSKSQGLVLTAKHKRKSSPPYKNEALVSNVRKPSKKTISLNADTVLNNQFLLSNKTLNISESKRRSCVTDTSGKVAVTVNSLRTVSQKHFQPVAPLNKKHTKETDSKCCHPHGRKHEELNCLGVEDFRVRTRSSASKCAVAKSQQPVDISVSVSDTRGYKKDKLYPGSCKHVADSISCEEGNLSEIQSYIHLQPSLSDADKGRAKPRKTQSEAVHTQAEVPSNSIRKSRIKRVPEKLEGKLESVSIQPSRRAHLQEVSDLAHEIMPPRQFRKRKTDSAVTEALTDSGSKIKTSVVTGTKTKQEKKEVKRNVRIQVENAEIDNRAEEQSPNKELPSEVVHDNGNVKKTRKRVTKIQQSGIAASSVATAESIRKVHTHKKPTTSKKKINQECKEDVIKQASQKFVGAHCSIAGGVSNAVVEAASTGARAFGLFVRNGRTWKLNQLDAEEAEKFKEACKKHGFLPRFILPHGSYLLNCGSSKADILQKSRDTLIHELQICEMLGLELYNFHPGSACGKGSLDECLNTVAESINIAHKKTSNVKTVIENMSCQGLTVGGKFEELKAIIDNVEDKSRVGVCLDTCHAFAAGFDLSTEDGFNKCIEDFDRIVGLQYLCAMHLNDSKGELGCHLDRHENIGKGHIGIEGFRCLMNDSRLNNIPFILETPVGDYANEIKILCDLEIL